MPKYVYEGPVTQFGFLLTDCWKGETYAPSESKARSNLIYQFKKNNNKTVGSKIILPGKIKNIG